MTELTHPRFADGASALSGTRHVFIDQLEVRAVVGVHEHEKRSSQTLLISVDLTVHEDPAGHGDSLARVVCYEAICNRINAIATARHVNLIETLAEQIAAACLEDRRVALARVRIAKPDAIAAARAVGIAIERQQTFGG